MLDKLEPVVAQLVSGDTKRSAMAGDKLGETLRSFSRWTLPSWAVRGTKSAAAHCPICFSDEPYVRLSWRLRAVTHCALHDRSLQTRCTICRRPLFHWDLARCECRCGAVLGRAQASARLDADAGAADQVQTHRKNWLVSSQEALQALPDFRGDCDQPSPDSLAFLVFLGALLPALVNLQVAGFGEEPRTIKGFLKALDTTTAPSKSWVEDLLDSLPSAAHLRTALNVVLALRHAEQTEKSALESLPLLEWAERLITLGASPAKAERRGLIEVGALLRTLSPLKAAAKQAGLTDMHLHALMARGVVVPTRTFEVGERQHLFSPEQVQFLTRFRHQGYSYGNSLDLGLEGTGVDILRIAGIVGMVPGNGGKTWLRGDELRSLLSELGERAIKVETVNGQMLNLGSKRIWQNRYVPALKSLFAKLQSGDVALWAYGDQPGFARFYVGVDALELLHRGAVGGATAALDTDPQRALALSDGVVAWAPTPAPWARRPRLGCPRSVPGTSRQLVLDLS